MVLGVDLGTTATKVVAVDRAGRVLGFVEHDHLPHTGDGDEVTHDPDRVVAVALRAVRECAARYRAEGREVAGLALTGAMHTLLALDTAGRPITPAMSWADNRARAQARRLRALPESQELHRVTGTPVHPFAPLSKLVWFAEQDPGTARRAARWCGLKDYVLFQLTDRLVTEHSNASGTGLMDIRRLAWHPASLHVAGVRAEQLPELCAPTEVLALGPEAARATGLPVGLPVVAGGGDGPLANLGVGAVRPGTAAVSLGTSGALRVTTERPGVDEGCRLFCYAIGDGLWVVGGAVSNGGVVTQWAAEAFGTSDLSGLLAEAAAVPVGANGLVALPYLLGERAPWWDVDARGALLGLRREHGRAEVVRALVEGVCQQLALVYRAVLATGVTVDSVRATGGAFRDDLWANTVAAALGSRVELAEDQAGSGLGAALLGWRALGEFGSLREAATTVRPQRVVEPDVVAAQVMAARLPVVERAYAALRELSAALDVPEG